jgi:hypothetical protein
MTASNFIRHITETTGNLSLGFLLVGSLGLGILVWIILRKYHLVVPAGQNAIIENMRKGGLLSYRSPGHSFLIPVIEKVVGFVSTNTTTIKGLCQVYLKDGYEVKFEWAVGIKLNPTTIDSGIQPSMMKILLTSPSRMINKFVCQCLNRTGERYTFTSLQKGDNKNRMVDQTAMAIAKYLSGYGFVLADIDVEIAGWNKSSQGKSLHINKANRLSERDLSIMASPTSKLNSLKNSNMAKENLLYSIPEQHHGSLESLKTGRQELAMGVKSEFKNTSSGNPLGKLIM